LAVVEDQTAPWYYRLTREYKLTSTVPLIRLLVQQSNCFVVVERGRAFGQMQTERSLNQAGELRQGSNFGQGQIVAADYSLNPMITFSQKDTRGVGGVLGGIPYAGAFGALAGSLRTSEASTTLTLVDNRSGVQLAAAEGAASNTDFAAWNGFFGSGGGGSLGGYTNTPEGKVLAGAFADAYNRLVGSVRNYKAQEVGADSGRAERWEYREVRLPRRKPLKARHLQPNPQQSLRLNRRPKPHLRSRFDLIVSA
jgi:curli biogenesis system outer membrane secretion channel CsgG